MGTCNKAILSYGIVIPVPKAIALLNALRKLNLPLLSEESTKWTTDQIDEDSCWYCNDIEELGERLKAEAKRARFEWDEYNLSSLGFFDESEGIVVFYNAQYDPEMDYADGMEVEFWGTHTAMTRVKRLVYKPWEDEEFMRPAKLAFKRLSELPSFIEANVKVDPDWLQAISVG